jgi:hypothetical protein
MLLRASVVVGLSLGTASAFTAPAIANLRPLPLAQSGQRSCRGPVCAPARRAAVPRMMMDPASVGARASARHT